MKFAAICTAAVMLMGAAFASPYPPTVMQFEGVVGDAELTQHVFYYFEDGYNLRARGSSVDQTTIWGKGADQTNSNNSAIYSWCIAELFDCYVSIHLSHWGAPFTLEALDATNLWTESWRGPIPEGLAITATGRKFGGGLVTQALPIVQDTWTTYSLNGFDNVAWVMFTAQVPRDSRQGDIAIDNLRLRYIPEPATLGLVLAGIAAAAVRRRRKV